MKSVINGETTLFVGGHYEVLNPGSGQTVTKYYFAGASRIAMRKTIFPQSDTLTYLLGDHLGSTSLAIDADTDEVIETRYKPWGEVRFTTEDLIEPIEEITLPTRYTCTGQYSYVDDEATDLGAAGFGLMFYNARWYDPVTGRFAQADSIVSGGVQGLDRYAYTNNAPINYVDPTGHFTEEAVWNYAFEQCHRDYGCATDLYGTWKADTNWWNMLMAAQPGNTMFGTITDENCTGYFCGTFTATFTGDGSGDNATLNGISLDTTTVPMHPSHQQLVSLQDIQAGTEQTNDMGVKFKFNWVGFFTQDGNGEPEFHVYKPGYTVEKSQSSKEGSNALKFGFDALLIPLHWSVGLISAGADIWGWGVGSIVVEVLDKEAGDLNSEVLHPHHD